MEFTVLSGLKLDCFTSQKREEALKSSFTTTESGSDFQPRYTELWGEKTQSGTWDEHTAVWLLTFSEDWNKGLQRPKIHQAKRTLLFFLMHYFLIILLVVIVFKMPYFFARTNNNTWCCVFHWLIRQQQKQSSCKDVCVDWGWDECQKRLSHSFYCLLLTDKRIKNCCQAIHRTWPQPYCSMPYPAETHGNASVSRNVRWQEIKVMEAKDEGREDGELGHNEPRQISVC